MSYPIEIVQDLNQNETVQSQTLNFETVPVTTGEQLSQLIQSKIH